MLERKHTVLYTSETVYVKYIKIIRMFDSNVCTKDTTHIKTDKY